MEEEKTQTNDDRFGTPIENIINAKKRVEKFSGKYPSFWHVPTRWEIATLPPLALTKLVVGWMEHSPTETIPSVGQIALLREALLRRADADQLETLLAMCYNYIHGV